MYEYYLRVRDSAILVLIHLVNELLGIGVRHVEASAVNESPEFVPGDDSVIV